MRDSSLANEFHAGYRPGVIAEIVQLHMDYYGPVWGFGIPFETGLATGLGAFLAGYNDELDLLQCARDKTGALLGAIAVSGRDRFPDTARIRWFIVDDRAQGSGLGAGLFQTALSFCRDADFQSAWLTTFEGLEAARALYLKAGFRLTGEADEDEWSGGVREQHYELRFY